jgi:hypothetical protein
MEFGPGDGDPIFRRDFNLNLKMPNPVAIPSGAD